MLVLASVRESQSVSKELSNREGAVHYYSGYVNYGDVAGWMSPDDPFSEAVVVIEVKAYAALNRRSDDRFQLDHYAQAAPKARKVYLASDHGMAELDKRTPEITSSWERVPFAEFANFLDSVIGRELTAEEMGAVKVGKLLARCEN
ncbi:hypothetical protein AXK60_13845 [Tsukamurella pseudospumae]|uniref:Uncharacterized protein n=2 Tax=Tsukamurella pseudospumae TaxID=239498 RepID=A0A138A472_9ACTN|nr:hypothetical protein AXK60_13845 [Tsukamurella pseudospumae]